MKAGRLRATAPSPSGNGVLLFWVGPHRFGIPARALKEIRNDLGRPPEEFGCWTILSAHALFGLGRCAPNARLLVLNHSRMAIRVDHVEKMIEAGVVHRLPQAFQGAERGWYSGLGIAGETVFPLVNPAAMEHEALRISEEPVSEESISEKPMDRAVV